MYKKNKDLPSRTGNYTLYPVITCNGKESEKKYIYIYHTCEIESVCGTSEANTSL